MSDSNPTDVRCLCFRIPADRLTALAALEQLVGGSFHRVDQQRLRGTLFDTPERALHAHGIELRVDEVGAERIQSVVVHAPRRALLHERILWRATLPGLEPDPERIADPDLRRHIGDWMGGERLEPQILVREWLRHSEIEAGASRIRVTLRLGEIGDAAGSVPFAQVEFALLSGERADLYALAARVNERVGLQVELQGDAERGWAAVDGDDPAPVRARRPHLPAKARLETVLEAALTSGLDQIAANADAVRLGRDPEGVHQMRVGARRTRSVLSLFKRLLPPGPLEELRTELGWLGTHLGPARDLDVFVDELLAPVIAANPHDTALRRLRAVAEEARREAQDDARSAVDAPRATAAQLALGAFIARRGWRDQPLSPKSALLFARARSAARRLLTRRHRRLQRSAASVVVTEHATVHALRIEVKKLRYAVEFLGSLYDGSARRRFEKRLGRLQTILGRFNDADVARRLLGELVKRLGDEAKPELHMAAGLVAGWASREAETQLARLDREWREFDSVAPFWKKKAHDS
jgi:inorganic triphosphatase YgiF